MKAILCTVIFAASLAIAGGTHAQTASETSQRTSVPGATVPPDDALSHGTTGSQGSSSNAYNSNLNDTPSQPPRKKVSKNRASASGADASMSGSAGAN